MASDIPIYLQNDPILTLTPINQPGIYPNTNSSLSVMNPIRKQLRTLGSWDLIRIMLEVGMR